MTEPLFILTTRKCYACINNLTGKLKECYACKHDLVGTQKINYSAFDDNEWECFCNTWDCKCDKWNFFFCPLCNKRVAESEHLRDHIPDLNTRWIANMVTHYRHSHIKYYENSYDGESRFQGNPRFASYYHDDFRKTVNERAKRQLIRKCWQYLVANKISADHFKMLREIDPKTILLAEKKLGISS